jgi:hypothetical protein
LGLARLGDGAMMRGFIFVQLRGALMTLNDLIQMYFDRANAYQWYWTLYVVIVGGLLAFSSLRLRQDLITLVLITVLFSIFAYKNGSAILDTLAQRNAAVTALEELQKHQNAQVRMGVANPVDAKTYDIMMPTLIRLDRDGVRNFHIISDVLVIITLWAFELRRFRHSRELRKSGTEPSRIV